MHLVGFILRIFSSYLLYFITAVKGSRLYTMNDFRYLYSRQIALAHSNAPSLFLNKSASRHLNFSFASFQENVHSGKGDYVADKQAKLNK